MAIHSRRPQDPPNLPKITIGSPPALPDDSAAAAAWHVARAPEGEAATQDSSIPDSAAVPRSRTPGGKPASAAPLEGWFVALLLAAVPLAAVFVLPSAMPVLLAVAGLLVVAGVVMFVRRS